MSGEAAVRVAAILAAARGFLGTRWHHMGRTEHGLDCVGLVLVSFRTAGLDLADAIYARGYRGSDMLDHIDAQGREVPLDPEHTGDITAGTRDGDVLLFADGLHIAHLGIRSTMYGDVPAVIHAHMRRRQVREEPLSADMGPLLRRAYRHPALEG